MRRMNLKLVPYDQIINVANGSREVRAFTFMRDNDLYAVYWHISGNKELELPISSKDFTLLEDIGKEIKLSSAFEGKTVVPLGNRHYIKTNKITKEELVVGIR